MKTEITADEILEYVDFTGEDSDRWSMRARMLVEAVVPACGSIRYPYPLSASDILEGIKFDTLLIMLDPLALPHIPASARALIQSYVDSLPWFNDEKRIYNRGTLDQHQFVEINVIKALKILENRPIAT